ncbi:MAG: hypothetical protein KDA28_14320 [Phycisphaerales bacterium]|nr:hypothetical protein [Phycisphaerales bacterium]
MSAYRDTRALYLFVAFILLGVVWVFFFSGWLRSREIRILSRMSPSGRLVFSLGDDYQVELVQVRDTVNGQVLWEATLDEGRTRRTFTYGEPQAVETRVAPEPLESGHDYLLVVRTSGGNTEYPFQYP